MDFPIYGLFVKRPNPNASDVRANLQIGLLFSLA